MHKSPRKTIHDDDDAHRLTNPPVSRVQDRPGIVCTCVCMRKGNHLNDNLRSRA